MVMLEDGSGLLVCGQNAHKENKRVYYSAEIKKGLLMGRRKMKGRMEGRAASR